MRRIRTRHRRPLTRWWESRRRRRASWLDRDLRARRRQLLRSRWRELSCALGAFAVSGALVAALVRQWPFLVGGGRGRLPRGGHGGTAGGARNRRRQPAFPARPRAGGRSRQRSARGARGVRCGQRRLLRSPRCRRRRAGPGDATELRPCQAPGRSDPEAPATVPESQIRGTHLIRWDTVDPFPAVPELFRKGEEPGRPGAPHGRRVSVRDRSVPLCGQSCEAHLTSRPTARTGRRWLPAGRPDGLPLTQETHP